MMECSATELKQVRMSSIERAVFWTEEFLNNLGGDFSVSAIFEHEAVLNNIASCSSYCGLGDFTSCDNIERAINRAIKVFDTDLIAGFIQCSEGGGGHCQMVVSKKPNL